MKYKNCLGLFHFICYGWGGLQGRISYGGIGGVMIKNWKNTYGGVGGYIPNFKHDYEEKTVKTYGGDGGGYPCFFQKKYGGIGGSVGVVTCPP